MDKTTIAVFCNCCDVEKRKTHFMKGLPKLALDQIRQKQYEEAKIFLDIAAKIMHIFVYSGNSSLSTLSEATYPTSTFQLIIGQSQIYNQDSCLGLQKPSLENLRIRGSAKLDVTIQVYPGLSYIDESEVLKFSPHDESVSELEQLAELIFGHHYASLKAPLGTDAKSWHNSLLTAFWPQTYGNRSSEIAFFMAILDGGQVLKDAKAAVRFIRLHNAFRRIFSMAEAYHFYLEHKEYVDRAIRGNLKVRLDGSSNYAKINSLLSNRVRQENELLRIDTDDLIAISSACTEKKADYTSTWQDYERTCLEILELNGYQSQLTKVGADYGGDITCIKNERTYVIQCKKLSKAVGISAVQEAVAARIHYAVDFAVVVSESGFTKAASELAERSETMLTRSSKLNNIEAHWD